MTPRRRLLGGAVALLVVALTFWISRQVYWAEYQVPAPLRGEAATNPFYVTQRLVQRLGATATWDRMLTIPAHDGLLVLSDWRWSLSPSRARTLQAWVEQGGRLVVDQSVLVDPAFQQWAGVRVTRILDEPARVRRRPVAGCRALAPLDRPGADRIAPTSFTLCDDQTRSNLEVPGGADLTLGDGLGAQVVRVRVGRGMVSVFNAAPYTRRAVFLGDHAALFVTASQLRAGDAVHFLAESEYPSILALAWTRGWPVVVLLLACVGAWLWRVGTRFGPMVEAESGARRSLEEQIRGTGEFTRRYGDGQPLLAATRRALEEGALRAVSGYAHMNGDERVAALARATGVHTAALASAMVVEPGHSPHFGDVIRTLETARRSLRTRQTRT